MGSAGFESGLVELDRTIEMLEEDRKIIFKLVEGKSSWEIRNFRVSVMSLAEGRGGLRERGEEWEARKELMVRMAESW